MISFSFREMLFSGVRKRDLTVCWVIVLAPCAYPPEKTSFRSARKIAT